VREILGGEEEKGEALQKQERKNKRTLGINQCKNLIGKKPDV